MKTPDAVGVPEMTPVVGSTVMPAGAPVIEYVIAPTPPVAWSVATVVGWLISAVWSVTPASVMAGWVSPFELIAIGAIDVKSLWLLLVSVPTGRALRRRCWRR